MRDKMRLLVCSALIYADAKLVRFGHFLPDVIELADNLTEFAIVSVEAVSPIPDKGVT